MKKIKSHSYIRLKIKVVKLNNTILKAELKHNLNKLNKEQFKMFWGVLVHYWALNRFFISNQNFLNLCCELNLLCYQSNESFPSPYDDHNLIKSFCEAHPYYFIDKLPFDLISNLFATYVDDHIDVLTHIVKILYEINLKAAYTYANKTLKLNEPIDNLVTETQDHIKYFS